MAHVLGQKTSQYSAAVQAITAASDQGRVADKIDVKTLGFIFSTRGSVLKPEAQAHLRELCIDNKHHNNIMILGACV
eukprot:1121577-Rhodomonas_salina.1